MTWAITHSHGGMSRHTWATDPKRLGIMLARYKHTAKLLIGYQSILEVGCADGMGAHIVRQHCEHLTAIDSDSEAIAEAIQNRQADIDFRCMDFMRDEIGAGWNAVYALDVLEHIQPGDQTLQFLGRMRLAAPVALIGSPSLESQPYASELSRAGHVNCMTGPDFRAALKSRWRHVFMFSMNDEVLHTGFEAMAHYRIGLCVA